VKLPTGQGGKVYTDRNNAEREARSLSSLTGRSYRAQSIVMPDGTRGYWVSNPRYQS
jgi:hypothetical protein